MNLFRQNKSDAKFFDLAFFPFFHVRDRGLDRGARQDGFVFENKPSLEMSTHHVLLGSF